MVDAIVLDRQRVLPCAALCQGEFGIENLFVGVPVRLGKDGIQEIVELTLSEDEQRALHESAAGVRELVETLGHV
jgi:malate dehydrogenase